MPGWEVYAILAVLLLLIFFLYLMVRRTVTGFKEGIKESQRK
ncbi:hypothetical protein [Halomicrobium sp. LC1Hm]|nr:hypothetical protein [Halomicrobium sp. LC1Hm]